MPNRLAAEHSPYLLQHAGNPVDWHPWGEDAFERARRENKVIFLSIGYSTCHWCHVMAHESFECQAVADLLNAHFVAIKVDREERPDVDRVYMTFVQATTGSGGWPMSVWLTPDLKPFFGGTYFPPQPAWGRPAFTDVLTEIARAWRESRDQIVASANTVTDRIAAIGRSTAGGALPSVAVLSDIVRQFRLAFDTRFGGFGDAPKFPRPSELLFLFREHARTGDESARDMGLQTLRAMALGGMRDQVGGGFHRYSVDGEWRVPHFEKMLYDQAQLVLAYLEAAQITGDPFYAEVAEDTLQYVGREMTDPAGGFYSAEDADSVPPGAAGDPAAHEQEGAFYVWSDGELAELLGDEADVVRLRFGVEPRGNAPHDPQGEFRGQNVLYTARTVEEIASRTGRTAEQVAAALAAARPHLYGRRASRPRPSLDDKIITAWNGLMIAAFARGARVLAGFPVLAGSAAGPAAPADSRPQGREAAAHLASAQRAATFLRERMWDPQRQVLRRRFRAGSAAIDGYAEDYASVIFGLVELFQADGDPGWLSWAVELQARQDALFWDAADGGWFNTTGEDRSVLLRTKEEYDGAEPAASSVVVLNLLALSHLTSAADYEPKIAQTLRLFGPRITEAGRVVPLMAAALSTWLAPRSQVVIAGDAGAPATCAMREAAGRAYLPFTIVVPVDPARGGPDASAAGRWTDPFVARDGRTRAYVCRDLACEAPITDPAAFESALRALTGRQA